MRVGIGRYDEEEEGIINTAENNYFKSAKLIHEHRLFLLIK